MKSHFLKANDVVLSSRWQFQDGRSKGMAHAHPICERGFPGGSALKNLPVSAEDEG